MNEIRKRLRARRVRELDLSAFENNQVEEERVLARTDVGPLTNEDVAAFICWANQLRHPHNYGFGWTVYQGLPYDIDEIALKMRAFWVGRNNNKEVEP